MIFQEKANLDGITFDLKQNDIPDSPTNKLNKERLASKGVKIIL